MRRIGWFRPLVLAVGTAALGACTEMQEDGLTPPTGERQTRAAAQGERLFTLVRVSALSNQDETQMMAIEGQRTTLDVQLGMLAPDPETLLQEGTINIAVSPNVQFGVVGEEVRRLRDGSIYWVGALSGEEGRVSLLLAPNVGIMGSINSERGVYKIRAMGNGLHALIRFDASVGFRDVIGSGSAQPAIREAIPDLEVTPDDLLPGPTYTVKVLIGYTESVNDALGGEPAVRALANLAIQEANQTYGRSGIGNVRLDRVGSMSSPRGYNENIRDFNDHLEWIENPDNYWSHRWRTHHKEADVAIILVNDGNGPVLGAASRVYADKDEPFAAIHYGILGDPVHGLAHEIGHLQGADHHRANDCDAGRNDYPCGPYQYGHGMVDPNGGDWRTIMAGCGECDGIIPFWSNPNKFRDGERLGNATWANNARVLRKTAWRTSHFVPPPPTFDVTITGPTVVHPFSICTWDAVPHDGNPPYTNYQWSGVLTGTGPDISGNVSQSGDLVVIVDDEDGRAMGQVGITVDEDGPSGCHNLTSTTVTVSSATQ